MTQPPGATLAEWAHLDLVLGLTEDLLPVVSRPDAEISELSKMGAVGKTPSMYNWKGKVVGVPKWPRMLATAERIADWSSVPDYGICVQTRRCRAIDIDVDSTRIAKRIVKQLREAFPHHHFPVRWRQSSPRMLIPFVYEGELYKRVLPVDSGMIEILATGQQFVACGTHQPSNTRYLWRGGLPASLPVFDELDMDLLWTFLVRTFGIGEPTIARAKRAPSDLALTGGHDDVADWLAAGGYVVDVGSDNKMFIECPFANQHTGDSGPSSTSYFPAGTGGYEQGKFVCLHAHCTHRENADYLEALGYAQAQFEDLTATTTTAVVEREPLDPAALEWPQLKRAASGAIEANGDNLVKAMLHPGMTTMRLAYDSFHEALMWAPATDTFGSEKWREFKDRDYTRLRLQLDQRGFKYFGEGLLRSCTHYAATERSFDAGIEWLDRRHWDGKPRVARFLADYFHTEDTEYAAACSLYAWTAHAGRLLDPGCQADMTIALRGEQGARKTSGVKAIAPTLQYFCEIDLMERDADLSRVMRGKMVGELAELRGLKSRDAEAIRAFMTRTHEAWVPKYMEFERKFARRLLFWATVNHAEFLADDEGERRWLPIEVCTRPGELVEVDRIARDRDQLWAEGAHLWREGGIQWQDAERLAVVEHERFKAIDPWHYVIRDWLIERGIDDIANGDKPIDLTRVCISACGVSLSQVSRVHKLRVAGILKRLGYERTRVGKDWLYTKKYDTTQERKANL